MCVGAKKRFYSIKWSEYNFYVKKSEKKFISKSVFRNLEFCIRGLIWILVDFGWILEQLSIETLNVLEFTRFCRFAWLVLALEWFWKHFQRLRVLPFDPQWKFTSILMFEFFSNFFKKHIFDLDQKKSWKKIWKIENLQNFKNRFFEILKFQIFQNFRFFENFKNREKMKFRNFEKSIFWNFEIFRFFRFFSTFFLIDEKYFFEKVLKNPDINIEVQFHCGSNGSTQSLADS